MASTSQEGDRADAMLGGVAHRRCEAVEKSLDKNVAGETGEGSESRKRDAGARAVIPCSTRFHPSGCPD